MLLSLPCPSPPQPLLRSQRTDHHRTGGRPSPGTALRALPGLRWMFLPFVSGCWSGSADVTGRWNPTSVHASLCAAFALPPSLSHPAPSAPPQVPAGACRPLASLLCHMQALGNWWRTACQGLFPPKRAPLQGTHHGWLPPRVPDGGRFPCTLLERGNVSHPFIYL